MDVITARAQGEDATSRGDRKDIPVRSPSDRVPSGHPPSASGSPKKRIADGLLRHRRKATGSKGSLGLAPAALGVIAIILENKLRFRCLLFAKGLRAG